MLLLLATAIFSLPFLAFSFFHILRGTDADGKWFCLFFGLLLGWVFLEFVATRETIVVDPVALTFSRTVKGLFRKKEQFINLAKVDHLKLELRRDNRGRKFQYLFLSGEKDYLINTPAKTYKDHRKTARQLSQITGLPFDV